MARKGGLGKGLDALIPGQAAAPGQVEGEIVMVPVGQIVSNPRQPRAGILDEDIQELAASIQEHGLLQPLVATQEDAAAPYVLIAGERRLRAARLAGLNLVPVLVRRANDQQRLELALIENLQRADLSPLETAEAYRQLHEDFNLSHEEIAQRVGKSRVSITNTLRLLKLPENVRAALADGRISEGHARALLGLNSPQAQLAVLNTILKQNLSVRQTEELVRKLSGEKPAPPAEKEIPAEIKALEERLRNRLGTKVKLRHGGKGGSLVIYYFSDEELEALLAQILKE